MLKPLIVAAATAFIQLVTCVPPPGGGGGGGTDAGIVDSGPPPTCPTSTLAAGSTTTVELVHGGRTRSFRVHVPEGYTSTARVPLVFVSHGLTQGANQSINGTDMVPVSDEAGFISVFPNGVGNSWNAGTCCSGNEEDDVGFFRAMVEHVGTDLGLCVDRTRVYATGFSNGAMMSYRLACEASDVFAAIASVAGSLVTDAATCGATQTRVVPLLEIHGDADGIVDYAATIEGVSEYAALSGCGTASIPAAQPLVHTDTTCVSRGGCPPGMEITTCTIAEGGHCWFGNETCGTGVPGGQLFVGNNAEGIIAATAVWGFLSRFDCPSCGL